MVMIPTAMACLPAAPSSEVTPSRDVTPSASVTPTPTSTSTSTPTVSATVAVAASPTLATATPIPNADAAITVSLPKARAQVRSPVLVQGTAMVFEANVQIRVRNAQGQVIGRDFTTATWGAPLRGDYTAAISFTLTGGRQNGTIEVFSESVMDGSEEDLVSVPVILTPN